MFSKNVKRKACVRLPRLIFTSEGSIHRPFGRIDGKGECASNSKKPHGAALGCGFFEEAQAGAGPRSTRCWHPVGAGGQWRTGTPTASGRSSRSPEISRAPQRVARTAHVINWI